MDAQERRRLVTEYITNNPGCNEQKVVKALEGRLSRVPVRNAIIELKKDGIIRIETKRANSRDYNLYVNSDNILVLVENELKEFEKSFLSLIENSKQKFDAQYLAIKNDVSSQNFGSRFEPILPLLSQPLYIFQEVVNVFLIRAMITWPSKVEDKEILKKLFTSLFTKLADIQVRISEVYRSSKAGDMNLVFQSSVVLNRLYATDKMIEHMETFTKLGMQNEIESVLSSMWKIYSDFKKYAFPEPRIYQWHDFDYMLSDWRTLIQHRKQNPDQTYRNYVQKVLNGFNK
jgi:hypothetical protein